MWRLSCFLWAATSVAAIIPTGTRLELRLTSRVSTEDARAGDPVAAVVIIPVLSSGKIYVPAGAVVTGRIRSTEAALSPASPKASLAIGFQECRIGAARYPMAARIAAIDNARESVDATGLIVGIDSKEAYTSRIDQGLDKLSRSDRFGGLAAVLETAKQALVKDTDPNITYDPGTDLTIELTRPLTVPTPSPDLTAGPIRDPESLAQLVNHETFQTYSQSPYRPSDVTNVMLIGSADQIRGAFGEAGWSGAARLNGLSKFETARALIEQRGYNEAPVSVLVLDERPPEMVFQKGNNTFSARHHIRVWRSPDSFAGVPVWICSSTHDTGIALSEHGLTFIHKIDSNIDAERAKVASDLLFTNRVTGIALVDRPAVPLHSFNATGDALNTDGKMVVLQLR